MRAQISVRTFIKALGGALSLLLALLLLCGVLAGPALLGPASALASKAKTKTKSKTKPHACADANLRPSAADRALVARATLCLIDQMRAAYHLRALRANCELQGVAAGQAAAMVRHDYFGDTSPSGKSPGRLIAAIPYGAHAARLSTAENIGWGTRSAATAGGIVAAWMRSPAHRELILTGLFRDVGIGVSPAVPSVLAHSRGATYAVEFAARG